MMRAFFARLPSTNRPAGRLVACVLDRSRVARPPRSSLSSRHICPGTCPDPASESGVSIIEVLISSLLVALIAIGTFSAFDSAGRASAGERAHAQATVLAQQDEERLRGLTAAQLGQLGSSTLYEADTGLCVEKPSSTWIYCTGTAFAGQAYSGTAFTVTSSARYVTASKESVTCETSGGTADYLLTTSSVKWSALGSRPAVTQSSIVTNPVHTALLVKVKDQNGAPLEGATVTVTGTSTNATQTTPAAGCVIFGGIADKTVSVVASKGTFVDHQGKSPPPAKSGISLSPTSLTEVEFVIAQPGKLVAEFESNGSVTGVTSDTFVAQQTGIASPPFFVGGTAGEYLASASQGGLFPFAEGGKPSKYTVYAGDCEANNPEVVTAGVVKPDKAEAVTPGGEAHVKVEVPAVTLTVWEGEASGKELKKLNTSTAKVTSDKITNKECSAATSQNYAKVPSERKVTITPEGQLQEKYQPYAKALELCVVAFPFVIETKNQYVKNTLAIANTAKAGTTLAFYLKKSGYQKSTAKLEC